MLFILWFINSTFINRNLILDSEQSMDFVYFTINYYFVTPSISVVPTFVIPRPLVDL